MFLCNVLWSMCLAGCELREGTLADSSSTVDSYSPEAQEPKPKALHLNHPKPSDLKPSSL